jgi:hypothetical protein
VSLVTEKEIEDFYQANKGGCAGIEATSVRRSVRPQQRSNRWTPGFRRIASLAE